MAKLCGWSSLLGLLAFFQLACSQTDEHSGGSAAVSGSIGAGTGGVAASSAATGGVGGAGTGGAGAGGAGTGGAGTGGEAGSSMDAGTPVEQWEILTQKEWTLASGDELTQDCADIVLAEDIYVSAIRPVHPLGTHHTTLSVSETEPTCDGRNLVAGGILYAGGVGTEALRLPPGVAFKLPAGHFLHLGLHLYNVTQETLTGVSGIEIVRMAPEDVQHEAEISLTGLVAGLTILPGEHTLTGKCIVTHDQTVFALFPHMHQLGTHLRTTLTMGGTTHVIHDAEYRFDEQFHLPVGPFELKAGDSVVTDCTYNNTTGFPVGFGESSTTEMCFSILFKYPATKEALCVDK